MKTVDFIIYGNNTGALVAALELGKSHKVAIINPAPNLGAHFAGITLNDVKYDIGMNYFEFTTFHKPSNDLMSYDPAVRNDSARFFALVENYVKSRIEVVQVDNIEVLCKGVISKDIVMANSLEALKMLPSAVLDQIRTELNAILQKGDRSYHASQKKLNEEQFMKASYYEVSMANHGPTFHELFVEPYCKKIFNMSSKDVPALLHRIAWAPLFYPETLMKGLDGKDDLQPTLFHYPRQAFFADIIERIVTEIRSNTNIEIIQAKAEGLSKENGYIIKTSAGDIAGRHLVWCNDLYSLFGQVLKDPELMKLEAAKASVTVAFATVNAADISKKFSCLYLSDMDTPLYRITNQEESAKQTEQKTNRLVFEMNLDYLNEKGIVSEQDVKAHLNQVLLKAGILTKAIADEALIVKSLKNAVNLPTLGNFDNFGTLYNACKTRFPDMELIGPAAGMVSTSFNDQVVQALKLGVKYN